jgi:hypothetical protein
MIRGVREPRFDCNTFTKKVDSDGDVSDLYSGGAFYARDTFPKISRNSELS